MDELGSHLVCSNWAQTKVWPQKAAFRSCRFVMMRRRWINLLSADNWFIDHCEQFLIVITNKHCITTNDPTMLDLFLFREKTLETFYTTLTLTGFDLAKFCIWVILIMFIVLSWLKKTYSSYIIQGWREKEIVIKMFQILF